MSSFARRRWFGIVPLLLALVLESCGDSTGASRLSRRYVLVSVDGAPLPFILIDHTWPDGRRWVRTQLADTLWLDNSTDWRSATVQHEVAPPYEPLTSRFLRSGTYTLQDDALTTEWLGDETSFIVLPRALRTERQVGPYCVEPEQPCAGSERMAEFLYAAR